MANGYTHSPLLISTIISVMDGSESMMVTMATQDPSHNYVKDDDGRMTLTLTMHLAPSVIISVTTTMVMTITMTTDSHTQL